MNIGIIVGVVTFKGNIQITKRNISMIKLTVATPAARSEGKDSFPNLTAYGAVAELIHDKDILKKRVAVNGRLEGRMIRGTYGNVYANELVIDRIYILGKEEVFCTPLEFYEEQDYMDFQKPANPNLVERLDEPVIDDGYDPLK